MSSQVAHIIRDLLAVEGGYVNHPDDRGGPTKYGITRITLSDWRSLNCTPQDVESLSEDEATEIYRQNYFFGPRINHLPEAYQPIVLDGAVWSGPVISIQELQRVLSVSPDGIIGPKTCAAAESTPPHLGIVAITRSRVDRLARLIQHDPSQVAFLRGWMRRALRFL